MGATIILAGVTSPEGQVHLLMNNLQYVVAQGKQFC